MRSLNDGPVHAGSAHPPPTDGARKKQVDLITGWGQPSSQPPQAILEIMDRESPLAHALYHVGVMSCAATRGSLMPPPPLLLFFLF